MEPLVALSLAGTVVRVLKRRAYERATISESYGRATWLVVTAVFGNTASEYERLQRVILQGSDDEALRFRQSVTNECNMTAVAGAIIAQVALTALSLADLSLAHWTARAFLLFATVAGCLSVYYACALSRDIGKLYGPELIRDWLSARDLPDNTQETERGDKKEKKASLSAIFILSAPYTMMTYAIWAFITGLAIYQGFVWTRNLDADAGKLNSRNVFIAYIVSTGFCQLFFGFAGVIKAIEDLLLNDRPGESFIEMGNSNKDHNDRHRDSERRSQQEERRQETSAMTPVAPIQTALEAVARAHLLCAEADRRVASEYAQLSRVDQL